MDVRLGELPLWVTTRDFSPQALLGGAQRGEPEFLPLGQSYPIYLLQPGPGGQPGSLQK